MSRSMDEKNPMTSIVINGYRCLMIQSTDHDFKMTAPISNYDVQFINDLQQKAHMILQAESDTRKSDRIESLQQHEKNLVHSIFTFVQKMWLQMIRYKSNAKVAEGDS